MSDIAIQVENISKRYRIGLKEELHDTFIGALTSWVKSPLSNFHRLQKLSKFDENEDSKDIIWALKDVSFEVKRGEVLGIIGRNGAGKSTLLKILGRITEPTSGRAETQHHIASLLEVGTGFHPELTGRENTYLNGTILGMSKSEIESKFDEIVDFSGVEKFIDTPIKRYSSGMMIRLAFSVAAHLEPEILLIDEVLAVGDVEFQKKCLGKMKDISGEGRTVLFVSHNMGSIRNLCTKGILLDSGRVLHEGDVATVIHKYLDSGSEKKGEVCWDSPDVAPGDERGRLKAVRIVSQGRVTSEVYIDNDLSIEVDYWNLEPNSKRYVSLELYDVDGNYIFVSISTPSMSIKPDPWYDRSYPVGLFRTECVIPAFLLNHKTYIISVSIFENKLPSMHDKDRIASLENILSFDVLETGAMRKETGIGRWDGIIRPRLKWHTVQLN